jgi:sulfite reductase (NADPH) hemoprotein beta-component
LPGIRKIPKPLNPNEGIKAASHLLRGTIAQDLADTSTGAISEANSQLTKFHGLYLQDDRDQRLALKKAGKEKAFSFMLRVRLPGGRATPQQWLVLDRLADEVASPSLRLTTRQTFQFHGVLKGNVKPLVKGMHQVLLDSIAACGDVNRNVMARPIPSAARAPAGLRPRPGLERIRAAQDPRLPRNLARRRTRRRAANPKSEPMYGATYLPRKFKVGFALPPSNDVDVFSQDLGFIAITEKGPSSSATTSRSAADSA